MTEPPSEGSPPPKDPPSRKDSPSPKDIPPLKGAKSASKSPRRKKSKVEDLNVETSIDTVDIEQYFKPPSELPPQRLLPISEYITVLDQGAEGASVGFAIAAVINYMRSELGIKELVSPRMLYQMGKKYDEWPSEDYEGTSIKGAITGWYQHGVCPDVLWPYQPGEPGDLSEEAKRVALQNKPESILRLRQHKEDWQWALNETHAIIAVAKHHRGWDKIENEGRIKLFTGPESGGIHLSFPKIRTA